MLKQYHFFWLAIIILLPGTGCGYNKLQGLDEEVKAAWAEVLNQYQRRFDLIPNLVNTVKGYAKHETETLQAVVAARAKVGQIRVGEEALNNPEVFRPVAEFFNVDIDQRLNDPSVCKGLFYETY